MKQLLSTIALMLSFSAFAQPPSPTCGDPSVIAYNDAIPCSASCANLHAAVVAESPTSAGIIIDDTFSAIINIGFNFTFTARPTTNASSALMAR